MIDPALDTMTPGERAYELIKRASPYAAQRNILLHIEPHGIRVQYRRDNIRSQQTVSWLAIEKSTINPIIAAVNEVHNNIRFRATPEGRDAERLAAIKRRNAST